jgi:protein involved in polysaccharide export with SLBB domain
MIATIAKTIARLAALMLLAGPAVAQTATGAATSDFQLNDQILLEVEGDSQFTKAFTVGPGPALMLPVIGPIPLVGVRRAQVEPYLTQQLKRYMKDPIVHAKVLVRLSVLGEVEHPGFYPVAADAPVSDALMAAGGPTKDAKFTDTHIDRIGRDGVGGRDLQEAIARGATVDGMGLRSGDQIVVPKRHDTESTFRIIGILAGIPAAILIATHLH